MGSDSHCSTPPGSSCYSSQCSSPSTLSVNHPHDSFPLMIHLPSAALPVNLPPAAGGGRACGRRSTREASECLSTGCLHPPQDMGCEQPYQSCKPRVQGRVTSLGQQCYQLGIAGSELLQRACGATASCYASSKGSVVTYTEYRPNR